MGHAFPVARHPLARVLLLPVLNVRVVDVLDQLIHIALVASRTAVPIANGDLILKIFFLQACIHWRAGDIARGVRGYV
jgi:hypothetical protein